MKVRLPVAILVAAFASAAQKPAAPKPPPPQPSQEQQDLERSLAAAGASPLEYLRAIEKHLERYPNTARRPELEAAAARAAIEAGDKRAIVGYGERVLSRRPDDLSLLAAVSRALIASDSREDWERGLRYARHSEDLLLQERNAAEHASRPSSELRDRIGRDLSRALQDEAEATGKLGRPDDALALARRAFETFPNAGAAREAARWCERLSHPLDAAAALADAITVPDPRAMAEERARDRARMGELYREAKGSDAGLGDMLLEAFDRNMALVHARQTRLRAGDPNAGIADPMDFKLAGLGGDKLSLATLKGKVVVLDFWATWCVPCRQEHPLLEQVRAKFAGNADVVFLSIDTDEDRSAVPKFVQTAGWNDRVYFEDGLSRALNVMSIPSTIVVGRDGNVFSRMTGFVAGQFVGTLSARIADALR